MDFIVCRDNADSLQHHGIKGQRWGIRRFQNEDRTWTEAGKERYNDGPGGGSSSGGSSGSVKSSVKNAAEKVKSGVSSAKDKAVSTAKDVKGKAENAINEAKKEPTQEELDARAARRKDIAKKVAIGVGITAAVVGTAFVAKYAHDKIKDLKAINSEDFADKLSASLDMEFKALDPHKTEAQVDQGVIKVQQNLKTGMAGVMERTSGSGVSRQSLKIDDAFDSKKIDNNKKHFFKWLNNDVDKYLKATLDDSVDEGTLSSLRKKAERSADVMLDKTYHTRDSDEEREYLTDVARDFLNSRAKDPARNTGRRDVRDLDVADELAKGYRNSSPESLRQLANTIRDRTGKVIDPGDFSGLARAMADIMDPEHRAH